MPPHYTPIRPTQTPVCEAPVSVPIPAPPPVYASREEQVEYIRTYVMPRLVPGARVMPGPDSDKVRSECGRLVKWIGKGRSVCHVISLFLICFFFRKR